jgi:hypothetical protein
MPDIINLIPDELKNIFCNRANIILDAYAYILYAIADPYIGMPINSETQARLCEDLYRMEIHARAERGKELWQVAATAFGFHPYRLPQRGHWVYAPQP